MSEKKVYIISDGGHDYSDAARFGELVFLTREPVRKDDIHLMYEIIRKGLSDATADDYLVVGSLTSMSMVAAFIQGSKWGEVHLLVFTAGQYVPKRLYWED